MSADGDWKITVQTPMGPQEVTATIAVSGDRFTGETRGPFGQQTIAGQADGDTLTWTSDIVQPMPLTLDFRAVVEGDRMSGTVKLGMFGEAPLNGVRI